MKEIILVKCGEIALKGLNRSGFEDRLVKNCRRRLENLGEFKFRKAQSTIYIEPQSEDIDLDEAVARLQKVFGIVALTRACVAEKNWEDITAKAKEYLSDVLPYVKTFKVEAKRSDKSFPMKSPEISREMGAVLLSKFHHLKVKVDNPDIVVMVEIREKFAYIHGQQLPGAGGMPVGSSGRALLLISGGIDSPVAGYMMARRGLELTAVHFYSYPYTSERARDKVVDLAKIVSRYSGPIKLHLVPFTEIQLAIYEKCPPKETTVLMRRLMMKIAQLWAEKDGARALITGEALGQVASQTLESLCVTDDAVTMPVFRPLIGFDKNDIVAIAKKIDTFNTSILPYEDCCTVFVPQHPVTKPEVQKMRESEALVDFSEMIRRAIENTETVTAI